MNQATAAAVALVSPFPGLRPFREDEQHLFFGRENQVDAMVDKLTATRFLAVVGTSGSGKSSLVNCGLRPALHRGLMASAGSSWRVAQFRPGSRPLSAMTSALATDGVLYCGYSGVVPLEELVGTPLRISKRGLIDAYRRARLPVGVNLLVVVDQFEELFRYQTLVTGATAQHEQSQEAIAFVNLLLEAKWQKDLPIYVVLTMRSDFLGNCAEFPGLPEAINGAQYLVPRLTREERRAAIKGPIGVGGAQISPVLLTRLVNDVGDNPDQLSILQHALNRTWAHWQHEGHANGPISLPHYESIGTMAQALDRHAEKAYGELSTGRLEQICKKVFQALTDKGTDARGVRRPTSLATLCRITGADQNELVSILDVFRKPSRSFLMPPLSEPLEPDSIIDISHESLMRVWERLKIWSDEEAQSAQLYRRLSETASLHAQDKAGLWRDPELQVALDWRRKEEPTAAWAQLYGGGFEVAMAFLAESETLRQSEVREKDERQKRELEYEKTAALAEEQKLRLALQVKSTRRLRSLMFALTILFGAALTATFWAVRQERRAERSGREATARELAAQALASLNEDPERSIILGMHAVNATVHFGQPPVPAAEDALQVAILSLPKSQDLVASAPITGIAYSPDGKQVVTTSSDGKVTLWDADTGRAEFTFAGHTGPALAVAYSPDGKRLVTTGEDGIVKVWDVERRQLLETLRGHSGSVNVVAYAPDGTSFASAGSDKTIKQWDGDDGHLMFTYKGHSKSINALAYGHGNRLASANSDGKVRIWDTGNGRLVQTLSSHAASVNSVAFSPDSKNLASASSDNTVKVWDLSKRAPIRNLRQAGAVQSVAYSPDGKTLATASSDNIVSFWDINKGVQVRNLPHSALVKTAVYSPDGKHIVTAGSSPTAQIWDLTGGEGLLTLRHPDIVNDVAYSPDGNSLATAGADKTARIWDATSGKLLLQLEKSTGAINSVAYSRNGELLATTSDDGTAKVWNAHSGELLSTLNGNLGAVTGAFFSPDGKFLVTANAGGAAIVWEVASKLKLHTLPHSGPVNFAVYSPNGKSIATASSDGTAKVWDSTSGKNLRTLRAKGGSVMDVSFSPDNKRLITANLDNSVSVWDAITGQLLWNLHGHAGSVLAVASSSDNRHFATASQDGTARIWDELKGQGLQTLSGHSGAVNSVAYSPNGKRLAVAYTDRTVQVYALDVSELLTLARSRVTRNLTQDECQHYFPNQSCPPNP